MLTRLEVQNYRGFQAFQMDGLARVNLLVGKNNSGKTALLEAAQFLVSGGDLEAISSAAHRRGEIIMRPPDRSPLVEIGHFFYGHAAIPDAAFIVAGNNGYSPIKVSIIAEADGEKENSTTSRTGPPRFAVKVNGGKRAEKPARPYGISRDGGVDLDEPRPWRRVPGGKRGDGTPIRFIATEHLESPVLVALWDEVQEASKTDDVVRALKILEPEIERFFMLSGMTSYGFVVGSRAGPKIHIRGQDRPLPLGSMGEGMRRLLSLSMSLATTREGFLFIDEVDTGLHYSVMSDMWRLLVQTAVTSGIQIFATTHSWDCIEGLGDLCRENNSLAHEVAVHKIERSLKQSVTFSGERLPSVVENRVEIR